MDQKNLFHSINHDSLYTVYSLQCRWKYWFHFVLINFKTWESFKEGFKVRYVNSKWVEVRTRNSNQTIGRVIDLESPQKVAKLPALQILYSFYTINDDGRRAWDILDRLLMAPIENHLKISRPSPDQTQRESKFKPLNPALSMKNKLFPLSLWSWEADRLNERLHDERVHLRKIFCLRKLNLIFIQS